MGAALLTTDRLRLRPFTASDLADLHALHQDPEVMRYLTGRPESLDEARRRLAHYIAQQAERGYSKWRAELADGTFAGRAGIGFHAPTGEIELGYTLRRDLWGTGLATEAARAVADWAFERLPIDSLIGFADVRHAASRRVLEKIGMQFEAERMDSGVLCAFYRLRRP